MTKLFFKNGRILIGAGVIVLAILLALLAHFILVRKAVAPEPDIIQDKIEVQNAALESNLDRALKTI